MSKTLTNESGNTVEVAFGADHVVFEPGESKTVADDFPEESLQAPAGKSEQAKPGKGKGKKGNKK